MGLFKEEGEIGIASDVVEVKSDNPVIPQFSKGGIGRGVTSAILNRGSVPPWLTREKNSGTATITLYWFEKTKQRTLARKHCGLFLPTCGSAVTSIRDSFVGHK